MPEPSPKIVEAIREGIDENYVRIELSVWLDDTKEELHAVARDIAQKIEKTLIAMEIETIKEYYGA